VKVNRQPGWISFAAIAVAVVLALFVAMHQGPGAAALVPVLPLLIISILPPAACSLRIICPASSQIPETPFFRALFQRPPPTYLA